MTEEEWLTAGHAGLLLNHLAEGECWGVLDRYLLTCCERVCDFFNEGSTLALVHEFERGTTAGWPSGMRGELMERTAFLGRESALHARTLYEQAVHLAYVTLNHAVRGLDLYTSEKCACVAALRKRIGQVGKEADCDWAIEPDPEDEQTQTHLLRCIVGNPFHPVVFNPAWRTETTVGIAAKMYDERDFAAMPILADALEEAGCDNADLLSHCREPGPHARGCWVVDGVLGKR